MSKSINILSIQGTQGKALSTLLSDKAVQMIAAGNYKEALNNKLVNSSLLKEALGKGKLGQAVLTTINTTLKPFVVDDIEVWFDFLSTIEEKGFTKRVEVFKYLYEQGYFGVQFTDFVAEILTLIDQPSIIRCTRKYGHVLYAVNTNMLGDVVTMTNVTNEARSQFDKVVRYAETIKSAKAAKKQYDIKQISISDLVQNKETKHHELKETVKPVVVSTSTSTMFEMAEEEGMDILVLDMSTLVFKGDDNVRFLKVLNILSNGIKIDGLVYYPLAQSASQSRTGKLYMGSKTPEEIKVFRDRISYGSFKKYDNQKVEVAKCEARVTLSATNTVPVGYHSYDYTQVVKDMELSVSYRAKQIEEIYNAKGKVVDYAITETEVTSNNATDGASYIHPKKAAEFAQKLGLISLKELNYFKDNYKSTKREVVMADAKLFRIFVKIPNVFQVRCGSIKGLVVMWDFDNELNGKYKGQSFVLHESIVKAIPDLTAEEQPQWRIANVNNKRWGRVRLSAQFMTVLEMDLADAVSLVKDNLETINATILTDANEALRFVNAIVGAEEVEDVETEGKELATKVATALSANPQLIKDKWVRKQLRKLVDKTVTRLKYGAVNVDGIYAYAVTDPRTFFRATLSETGEFVSCEECLQSGQYYLNGKTGTVAGLRAPHIHNTESQLLDLVDDEELWFLSNLIVFNPYDMTAQASQGMDFDGDQMLITDDARIVRSIKRDDWMILQGLGREAQKHLWNIDSVYNLYAARSKRDNVGNLSNYALLFKEYKNHLVNLFKYKMVAEADKERVAYYIESLEEKVIKLACLIGAEIDKAKTGVAPTITDDLVAKIYPEWWIGFKAEIKGAFENTPEARETYRKRLVKRGGAFYGQDKCLTPVGACYSIVSKWQEENMKDFQGEAGTTDLARALAKDIYIADVEAVMPKVQDEMKNFNREMMALQVAKRNGKIQDEEVFQHALTELYDRYQVVFDQISEDKVSVAAAAYLTANGGSAPWIFCFEGLITLFSKGTHTMLFAVPSYLTEGELVEADNGGLFVNKRFAGETSLPCGRYGVQMIGGRPYVLATRKGQPKVKQNESAVNKYENTKIHTVTVMGFNYNGTTATSFMEALTKAKGIAEVHTDANGRLVLYVNDVKVAAIKHEDTNVCADMTSTRIQFASQFVDPTYTDQETGKVVERKSLKLHMSILESVEKKEEVLPESSYIEQNFDEMYNTVMVEDMLAQYEEIEYDFVNQYDVMEATMDFDIADFQ